MDLPWLRYLYSAIWQPVGRMGEKFLPDSRTWHRTRPNTGPTVDSMTAIKSDHEMGLRESIEDYVISLELGEHEKVSQLSSKICSKLIETLDDYLIEREEDNDDEGENDGEFSRSSSSSSSDKELIQVIGTICDRIRKYDDIAVAYHDVREFVHVYDMVCFSRMVGAINQADSRSRHAFAKQPEHGLPIDVDCLAHITRSASHLLRYMNGNEYQSSEWCLSSDDESQRIWFNVEEHMEKICSVGFPIYTLDISSAISAMKTAATTREQLSTSSSSYNDRSFLDHQSIVCSSCSNDDSFNQSELSQILVSKWFQQFLNETLGQNYPLDRFSSLIALWIVADICKCNNLEQMISELVDQIFHDESNSCNIEELMQLGNQIGSYWLSYHRRYRVTFAKANTQAQAQLFEDEEEDEVSQIDDDSASENSAQLSTDDINSNDNNQLIRENIDENSRAKLRRLLRDELLEGPSCLICDGRPREPLACLRGQQQTCPNCSSRLFHDFCAISRRTLPLIRLETLLEQISTKQNLVLMSQSEWTRQAMLASGFPADNVAGSYSLQNLSEKGTRTDISERIDIEANFERLTIIRDERQEDDEQEEESMRDDDEVETDEATSDHVGGKKVDSILKAFMTSAKSRQNPLASESVKMLRFDRDLDKQQINCSQKQNYLFLCSNDFLILDYKTNCKQVELRLMATTSSNLFSNGSLWVCNLRSSMSKLKLGCGRLFSSLELLRHPSMTTSSDVYTCCFCQRELRKVHSFPGDLNWPMQQPPNQQQQHNQSD